MPALLRLPMILVGRPSRLIISGSSTASQDISFHSGGVTFRSRLSTAEKGREIRRLITKSLMPAEKTKSDLMNGLEKADTPLLVLGNGQHAKCAGFIA